jgi:LysM repeat protein
MNSTSRWGAIRRGIRERGREIALVIVLLLINYLIFSRLLLMISQNRQPPPTPTRTAKPTFTPFEVVVPTATLAPEPTATVEPSPSVPSTPRTHVVQPGETLSGIARTYGTTVDAIVEANDLGSADAIIREGQELLIPVTPAPLPTEEGTAGPASTPSSTEGRRIHVVQQGETLSEIARNYGVTAEALVQANGLDNPNAISVGQALVIP